MSLHWLIPDYTPSAQRVHARRFVCDLLTERPTQNMVEGDTAFVFEDATVYVWTAGAWAVLTVYPWGVVPGRELLTGSRDYYVRTDGSNGNDGSADDSGHAFRSIQYAVDLVCNGLNFGADDGSINVNIHVANGTYAERVVLKDIDSQYMGGAYEIGVDPVCYLIGNTSSPGSVVINDLLALGPAARWGVDGFGLGTHGNISATGGAALQVGAMNIGAGGFMVSNPGSDIYVRPSHTITKTGNSASLAVAYGGRFRFIGPLVLSGTPAFGDATVRASNGGVMVFSPGSITGSATGKRYLAEYNGIIDTNGSGATYIPGSTGGSTASGGQYL